MASFKELERQTKAFAAANMLSEANFRDMSLVDPRIQPRRLYRSGTVNILSHDQARHLVEDMDLRTIIALRDADEDDEDPGPHAIQRWFRHAHVAHELAVDRLHASESEDYVADLFRGAEINPLEYGKQDDEELSRRRRAKVQRNVRKSLRKARKSEPRLTSSIASNDAIPETNHNDWADPLDASEDVFDLDIDVDRLNGDKYAVKDELQSSTTGGFVMMNKFGGNRLVKYHVPLTERRVMTKALLAVTSWTDKTRVAFKYLAGLVWNSEYKESAKGVMLERFNELGLVGLNKIILQYSQQLICRTLKIVATVSHHAVVIHCYHGKDRTGLVVALILLILGTPREFIVNDYHLSEEFGKSPHGRAHFEKIPKLDADKWCLAPREVMEQTLQHLDDEYGGIEAFCDLIGFHDQWRCKLRQALTIPGEISV